MNKRTILNNRGAIQNSLITFLGVLITCLTLLVGTSAYVLFFEDEIDKIIITEEFIPPSGGTISIDNDSIINGLILDIPSGSYSEGLDVRINVSDISNIDFVEGFNPETPLIIIDNLHQFSNIPMTLSIPITIDTNTQYAMAFFYDIETEKLEAIPTISLDSNQITISSSHFSSIIVSSITIEELEEMDIDTLSADSGFRPGVDDWSFANYGSAIVPKGHCAGQSITAAYYYISRKKALKEESLWNRFDNNGDTPTPDFWYDDSNAYRYASMVQLKYSIDSKQHDDFSDFSLKDDFNVYNALLYAIHITGDPQYMAIYSRDFSGKYVTGHAIIIYKVNKSRLYVSDPNYPGQTNRYINFNTFDILEDYSSGANANDIESKGAIAYDSFVWIGLSALIDYKYLEDTYQQLIDGTIGDYIFPTLEIKYMSVYDKDPAKVKFSYVNYPFVIPANYNDIVSEDLINKIFVVGTVDTTSFVTNTDVVYSIFIGTDLIYTDLTPVSQEHFQIFIPMERGMNKIGVLVESVDNSEKHYVDFRWFEFTFDGSLIIPEEQILGRYEFSHCSDGQVFTAEHYIEIYENGSVFEAFILLEEEGVWGDSYAAWGTWSIVKQNDGSYTLISDSELSYTIYIISEDFSTISFGDDPIWYFNKE